MKKMQCKLLSRDLFREAVFHRDNFSCVICGKKASDGVKLDAHHIIERRLFRYEDEKEGYFLDNGASLCDQDGTGCHSKAEMTLISCDEIRDKIGIKKPILPHHLYDEFKYDKWGNIIFNSNQRLRGELFFDESVQKILKAGNILKLFSDRVKHPRTSHLPWSEAATEDDTFIPTLDVLKSAKEVIVTVKYDGEQTTIYNDGYLHARSIDGRHTPAQNWVRSFAPEWGQSLPKGWRICGENMYEEHTIAYKGLKTYFYVHSIWDEKNTCLSYDNRIEWCELLGLTHVPLLYRGPWDESKIKSLMQDSYLDNPMEGYVVSVSHSFNLSEFTTSVGKYVAAKFGKQRDSRHGTRSNRKNIL